MIYMSGCECWLLFQGFLGQIAQFVYEYLDAPVSLKEIMEDTKACGEHRPDIFYRQAACEDETQYRYALGPFIKQQVPLKRDLLVPFGWGSSSHIRSYTIQKSRYTDDVRKTLHGIHKL